MSNLAYRYSHQKEIAAQGMNAAFLKVLDNLKKYDETFSLATFIRKIFIHHMIDEYRKEKKYLQNIELQHEITYEDYSGFNAGEINLESRELMQLLDLLPELTGKIFNLFAVDGYKHSEISELLNIPEGTSKWHVSEARKQLKTILYNIQKQEEKNLKMEKIS